MVLVLIWALATRLYDAWPFSTDDAFITLRYGRHLGEGLGLRWNAGGPRVEGYSNFAYVLLAAALEALGSLSLFPFKVLGGIALAVTLYVQFKLARMFVGKTGALVVPALYLSHYGPVWWAVSGLETPLYSALVDATLWLGLTALGYGAVAEAPAAATREPSPRLLILAGMSAWLVSLVRPEGPLIFIALLGAVVVKTVRRRGASGESWRRRLDPALRVALGFVPLFGFYAAWRWLYFGELVPNTVLCKTGYADRFKLIESYLSAAPIALALAAVQLRRLTEPRTTALWLVILGYFVILIGADPIVAGFSRHFLAAHTLVCVFAVRTIVDANDFVMRHVSVPSDSIVHTGILATLFCALVVVGLPDGADYQTRAMDYVIRSRSRAELARYLRVEVPPQWHVALGDLGLVGWLARRPIIDSFCLNEPGLSHPPANESYSAAADWLLAQNPEVIVVHSRSRLGMRPRGLIHHALIEKQAFLTGYIPVVGFGAKSFNYLVFQRRDLENPDQKSIRK